MKANQTYKVKVTYGNKVTRTMELTGQQIKDRRKLNEKRKNPYITIEVIEERKDRKIFHIANDLVVNDMLLDDNFRLSLCGRILNKR